MILVEGLLTAPYLGRPDLTTLPAHWEPISTRASSTTLRCPPHRLSGLRRGRQWQRPTGSSRSFTKSPRTRHRYSPRLRCPRATTRQLFCPGRRRLRSSDRCWRPRSYEFSRCHEKASGGTHSPVRVVEQKTATESVGSIVTWIASTYQKFDKLSEIKSTVRNNALNIDMPANPLPCGLEKSNDIIP